MLCDVKSILCHPIFEKAKLIAGQKFLNNAVNRISVFDCPVKDSIIDKNIIERGDLFLSGLDQFEGKPEALQKFISILINTSCSALIITDEHPEYITTAIIEKCNKNGLPIIMLDHDIPYAVIMDAINKLTIQQYNHTINGIKIHNLRENKLSAKSKELVLFSINPRFAPFVCVVSLEGEPASVLTENDLNMFFLKRPTDTYVASDGMSYFLLTNETVTGLDKSVEFFSKRINEYFKSFTIGISNIHPLADIDLCFKEAAVAYETALSIGESIVKYKSDSLLQLVVKLQTTDELYSFYNTMLSKINQYRNEKDVTLFETLKEYVKCKGSFHDTAESLGQVETTIRYRINKLRQILGLEDNLVQFHAYASMLVIADQLLNPNNK